MTTKSFGATAAIAIAAICTPPHFGNRTTGRSYVVFGKNDSSPVELSKLDAGQGDGYAILGTQVGSYCGKTIASIDDVNGDGLSDLLMGCPFEDGQGGAGRNSILLLGTGVTLDLSQVPRPGSGSPGTRSRIDSIRRIDLGRQGGNDLHVKVADDSQLQLTGFQ